MSASVALAACSLLPPPFGTMPGTIPGAVPASPAPTGTTRDEIATQRARWRATGIDSYRWTISYMCECGLPSPIQVTVADGTVMAVTDANGRVPIASLSFVPLTVEAMYEKARLTLDHGGIVTAEWNPITGRPISITFDPLPQAIDDELMVSVGSFQPMPELGPSTTPEPGPS
jgi:hypothetical protein